MKRRLLAFLLFLQILSPSLTSAQTDRVSAGDAPERPRIGLVLSGGGAKGFAEIGALKMLDSLNIPVDYIAGTSMGGIIGALYSIGYTGAELEKLAFRKDWQEIFTDRPTRAVLPYFQKKDIGKYQLEFGLRGFKPTPPSGLIYGQKLSLLFSSLTIPYKGTTDFDQLPIPFRCVAVDLVTGNQVVLRRGSLAKAMQATMAIPTVFSPVEWGDSLLVDGALLNNLPVDIVKEMGADIIIAVDVGTPLKDRTQLNSALAVLEQSISMFGRARWIQNVKKVDILIRPNIAGFNASDFDNEKIARILQRGIDAAEKSLPQLAELSQKYHLQRMQDLPVGDVFTKRMRIYSLHITGQTTVPFQTIYDTLGLKPNDLVDRELLNSRLERLQSTGYFDDVQCDVIPQSDDYARILIRVEEKHKAIIHGIYITGNRVLPFSFIYRLLGLKPSDRLDTADLNKRIMEMYGLGYFERIDYDIEPVRENSVDLKLNVKELPLRRLRVGLRYDDVHKLVAAVGIQATNLPVAGMRLESDLQFAGLTRFMFKASYPSRTLSRPIYPFARLAYKDVPTHVYDERGAKIARYNDRSTRIGIGLGMLLTKWFDAEVAYQHEYMNIKPSIAFSDPLLFPTWKDHLSQISATLDVDVLDDVLVPRSGVLIYARYEAGLKQLNSDVNYDLASVSADLYQTFHRKHTARLHAFWGTGSPGMPLYKFHNQGRPDLFVGIGYDQLFGRRMSLVRLGYRYQYKKDIFFKAMTNVAFDFEYGSPTGLYPTRDLWGWGLGVMLLSPVGPIEVIFARGDRALNGPREVRSTVYFTLGYKF